MGEYLELFQYLREQLISWQPKTTPYGEGGYGFDETNVLEITGSLPSGVVPFDFVTFALSSSMGNFTTVSMQHIGSLRLTIQVDVYAKAAGVGKESKRATQDRLLETSSKVIDIMAGRGYNPSTELVDWDFSGGDIGRMTVRFTSTIYS